MRNRAGRITEFKVNAEAMDELKRYRNKLQDSFPRIGILIVSYNASGLLRTTVSRIPTGLKDVIEEIYIFDDASTDDTYSIAEELPRTSEWDTKLKAYENPVNVGYGGNQKIGFQYAIERGFDFVVVLHGDGQYAPEFLPELLLPLLKTNEEVVFGSRMMNWKDALAGGMPLYKLTGNKVLTAFENFVLGMSLSEYHTGYRIYSVNTLRKIPFMKNTNDFHFDSQIIVQLRVLGAQICEIPIKAFYGEEKCHVSGLKYALDVCRTVIEYRLHQLHIVRRAQYLAEEKVIYTRKRSTFSSHTQILELIENPGRALDFCSNSGLLTQSLLEKGVESVGVDRATASSTTAPFKEYLVLDLENYESLSFSREFDYIIFADVLEHLKNAKGLLKHCRKLLKSSGTIIVSVPNIAIWFYRLSLLCGRFNYGPKGILDETHVKFYTLDTIRDLLNECGFVVRQSRFTGLPFEVVFASTGRSRVLKVLEWLYFQAVRLWPRLFAYQVILEAGIASYEASDGEGQLYPSRVKE